MRFFSTAVCRRTISVPTGQSGADRMERYGPHILCRSKRQLVPRSGPETEAPWLRHVDSKVFSMTGGSMTPPLVDLARHWHAEAAAAQVYDASNMQRKLTLLAAARDVHLLVGGRRTTGRHSAASRCLALHRIARSAINSMLPLGVSLGRAGDRQTTTPLIVCYAPLLFFPCQSTAGRHAPPASEVSFLGIKSWLRRSEASACGSCSSPSILYTTARRLMPLRI